MARILGFLLAICGVVATSTHSAGAAGTGLTLDPCTLLHNTVIYSLLGVSAAKRERVRFTLEPRADGWASCSAGLSRSGRSISLALTQTAALKLHYEYKQRACTSPSCIAQIERAKARASAANDFYCYQFPRLKKVDFYPDEVRLLAAPGDRAFNAVGGLYVLRGDAEISVYVTAPEKERKEQLDAEGVALNDTAAALRVARDIVTRISTAAVATKPTCL